MCQIFSKTGIKFPKDKHKSNDRTDKEVVSGRKLGPKGK